jgi:regulator of protease activity HflC (stomatin/prohibitin superfamily)
MVSGTTFFLLVAATVLLLAFLFSAIKIVREYERGVIFRLGRLQGAKGPGLFFIIPIIDTMVKVDLRIITADVPVQEVMTKDNVPVQVNAVTYYRVMDPETAVVEVENYRAATGQIAQTTLRSVVGKSQLDELLSERERLNQVLQETIDEATDPWGIKVTGVEIKDVELPSSMQRAMAKQAEAERERRAQIINAEGEHQASRRLAEAAHTLGKSKGSMFIRMLQTITDATAEKATTMVVPLPMEMLRYFDMGEAEETDEDAPSPDLGETLFDETTEAEADPDVEPEDIDPDEIDPDDVDPDIGPESVDPDDIDVDEPDPDDLPESRRDAGKQDPEE